MASFVMAIGPMKHQVILVQSYIEVVYVLDGQIDLVMDFVSGLPAQTFLLTDLDGP